jgi:hypothetical protein
MYSSPMLYIYLKYKALSFSGFHSSGCPIAMQLYVAFIMQNATYVNCCLLALGSSIDISRYN